MAYAPAEVTVAAGDTIVWVNQDIVPHTVTGEARQLATQLPEGLRAYAFAPSETGERFGLDVFVQRVMGRADVDVDPAKEGIRAVFDTLRDAVTPAGYDDVISQLPAEFAEVVELTAPFVQRTR